MRRVYKYPLRLDDLVTVELPGIDPQPLTVQMQGMQPCLWALVDPTAADDVKTPIQLRIAGTGHDIEGLDDPFARRGFRYLNTFQMHGGGLVFHVFYREGT